MSECECTPPSWLNKTFIESILSSNDNTLYVDELHVSAAVGKGINYASELLRVTVDCHDNTTRHFRRYLIVKDVPKASQFGDFIESVGSFKREVRMYEKTLPALRKILGEASGGFAPNSYPSGRTQTIIMDDLKTEGFKMADRPGDGLDFDHCRLVLLALARMHSASLIHLKRNPQVVDEYKEAFHTAESLPKTSLIYEPMFTRLVAEVATWSGYESYSAKLRTSLNLSNVIDTLKPKLGESLVITHGDPYLLNMLFHYTDDGNVDSVKLVDFQEVRPGSPATDVEYFYVTSASIHVREKRWTELLEIYHAEYCNVLKLAGEEELILDDMRTVNALKATAALKATFGLLNAAITLPLASVDTDAAPDFGNTPRKEGDEENDNVRKMYAKPNFVEAFKQLIGHFDETIWQK